SAGDGLGKRAGGQHSQVEIKNVLRIRRQAHTGEGVSGNNDNYRLQSDILHGRGKCDAHVNAVGVAQFQRLAGKPDSLRLAGKVAEGIDAAHVADVRMLQRIKDRGRLSAHLRLEVGLEQQVVAAQAYDG